MSTPRPPSSASYQFFMLVLCIYALAALAIEGAVSIKPEIRLVLEYADYGICVLFFVDFVFSLWRAENRFRHFFTWGWLDLLSSIPMVDFARWGRIARVVRIFRVLRGLRAARLLTSVVLRHRAENSFLAASLAAILLIVFCSVAILHFETEGESNIKSAEDAIWWSFTTITTVGYGDRYPVTSEGRFVAALLMCAGVGLFGTLSGLLAAWFLGPEENANESAIQALREEIAALRKAIESRSITPKVKADPGP
jgi:voltage-gated potassium channel